MNILIEHKKNLFFYILSVAIVGFTLFKGVLTTEDTGSYISFYNCRSMGYPLLIKLYQLVFSGFYDWALVISQALLGAFSVGWFLNIIKEKISLNNIMVYVIGTILSLPYFTKGYIANYIGPEALCYTFYIFSLGYLLQFIHQKEMMLFYKWLFCIAVLILFRRQFLFMYPLIAIVIGYSVWQLKVKLLPMILSALISMGAADVLERSYHFVVHDRFAHVPFTGFQMIVLPLVCTTENDASTFEDKTDQHLIAELHMALKTKNMLLPFGRLNSGDYLSLSFGESYNPISYGVIGDIFAKYYGHLDHWAIDQKKVELSIHLIKNNFQRWIKAYSYIALGNYGLSFVLFVFAVLIMCFFYRGPFFGFAGLMCISFIGNNMAAALVEPVLKRYSFYTDFPMIMIFSICVYYAFEHVNKSKKYESYNRL